MLDVKSRVAFYPRFTMLSAVPPTPTQPGELATLSSIAVNLADQITAVMPKMIIQLTFFF